MSREAAKTGLIAILNASNRYISQPEDYDPDLAGMPWREAQRLIERHHSPLHRLFYTGEGLRLHYVDSQIAERVLLHFAARDIVCLPIHDSFIVQRKHSDELAMVMRAVYKAEVGFEPKIKRVVADPEAAEGDYSAYEKRQKAWRFYMDARKAEDLI
jgi:hypothetical protein